MNQNPSGGLRALVAVLLCSAIPAAASDDWSFESRPALGAYLRADYAEAERLLALARAGSREAVRDADVLHAMILARSSDRLILNAGRARLEALLRNDPALQHRPEVWLALGSALLELNNTPAALAAIGAARDRFSVPARRSAANVALAKTWAQHNDWTRTLALVPEPADPNAAQTIRIERVRELLTETRTLSTPDDVAEIELVLGELLLESDSASARELLEGLSQREDAIAGRAAWLLAPAADDAERWNDAVRLYEAAAQHAPNPADRAVAADRLRQLRAPQLELRLPATARPDEPLRMTPITRGVSQVEFELRRVDLGGWLTQRSGRFAEQQLPTSGALALAPRAVETNAATESMETIVAAPIEFTLPAGAYVAILRGTATDGAAITHKHLLVVSRVDAAVLIGRRQAVAWCSSHPNASAARVRFWAEGAIRPRELALENGLTQFALPPAASLFNSRRWAALFQVGDEVAFCRGDLPARTAADDRASVIMTMTPQAPTVAGPLTVLGHLDQPLGDQSAPPVTVALVGGDGRVLDEVVETPSDDGFFSATLRVPRSAVAEPVHVETRRASTVLPSRRGRDVFRPNSTRPPVYTLQPTIAPFLPTGTTLLDPSARVVGPAGVIETQQTYVAISLKLPTDASPERLLALGRRATLQPDATMEQRLIPLETMLDPNTPNLIRFRWSATLESGLAATAEHLVLLADEPIYAWLEASPSQPVAREPVTLSLGVVEPAGQAHAVGGELEIIADGEDAIRLPLFARDEMYAASVWRPAHAGQYSIVARIRRPGDDPLVIARRVSVGPSATDDHIRIRSAAAIDDRIAVQLATPAPTALLVLHRTHDIVSTGVITPGDDNLSLPRDASASANNGVIELYTMSRDALVMTRQIDLSPTRSAERPSVELDQTTGALRVAMPFVHPTRRLVRMTRVDSVTRQRFLPGADPPSPAARLRPLIGADSTGRAIDVPGPPAPLAEIEAWHAGATTWAGFIAAGEAACDAPPLPEPGAYAVYVWSPTTGASATSVSWDPPTHLAADAPQQLTVGDRLIWPLRVPIASSNEVAVRVRPITPELLNIDASKQKSPVASNDATDVSTWVIEAAAPGVGSWVAEALIDGSVIARREFVCQIDADPHDGAEPRVTLQRRLFALDPATGDEGAATPVINVRGRAFRLRALLADEPIALGERVLMRETIQTKHPLGQLSWVQRSPPNMGVTPFASDESAGLGSVLRRDAGAVVLDIPGLSAAPAENEYIWIAATRGACYAPPPTVTNARGESVAVGVQPLRIVVR